MAFFENDSFKNEIERGRTVFEAYNRLSKREIVAMYYWYTNLGILFKECHGLLVQAINFQLASKLKPILLHMTEIDPSWGGGHAYYALALYYSRLPKLMGGDLAKADDFSQRSIEKGPNWLYSRWGRAKYLYTKTRNREAFKKDLEWVIAQDPHMLDSPYAWNVFFQSSAREMLRNMHTYFK